MLSETRARQRPANRSPRPVLEHAAHEPCGNPRRRILIAEDDSEMRAWLREVLERSGADVIECANGRELMVHVGGHFLSGTRKVLDLVVSDIQMPWATGLEAAESVAARQSGLPMLLITAFGSRKLHEQVRGLEGVGILNKPFQASDLLIAIERLMEHGTAEEVTDEGRR